MIENWWKETEYEFHNYGGVDRAYQKNDHKIGLFWSKPLKEEAPCENVCLECGHYHAEWVEPDDFKAIKMADKFIEVMSSDKSISNIINPKWDVTSLGGECYHCLIPSVDYDLILGDNHFEIHRCCGCYHFNLNEFNHESLYMTFCDSEYSLVEVQKYSIVIMEVYLSQKIS